MKKEILVIGATSDIAKALVKEMANNLFLVVGKNKEDDNQKNTIKFVLCARNSLHLKEFCTDIWLRYGVICECVNLNFDDLSLHKDFVQSFQNLYGVIYAAGYMPVQRNAQKDFLLIQKSFTVNLLAAFSIIESSAEILEQKNEGFIIAISSVAGDRGRASNYIYGSAKAGLSTYMSGLSNRFGLQKYSKVKILCVKPGFVRTKMTANLPLPALLTADPSEVARDIVHALSKDSHICYTKSLWKWIMCVIKCIPHFLFNKLKL